MTDDQRDAIEIDHADEPARTTPRRRRRIVLPIVGAAALLLVGGGAAALWALQSYQDAPVQATERFLTAVADGDLDTVTGFLSGDADITLVTQEVLDASLALAPIDDIEVTGDRDGVEATFTIGDAEVTRTFDVDEVDGGWVVWDAVTPLPWLADYSSVDIRLNGAEIPDVGAMVLPGTYELTLDSPHFALDGETTHTIASEKDADRVRETTVVMSPEGAATFTQLVSAAVQECLAARGLTSPCGIDIDPAEIKGTFDEGSAVRTLVADAQPLLTDMPHVLDAGALMTARAAKPLTVDVDFTTTAAEGTWEYEWDGYALWPHVDFSVEPFQVSWSG